MTENNTNMNFWDYNTYLKNLQPELRDQICTKLGFSKKTFYNKYNAKSFTYPEQLVIAEIIGKPHSELFPNQKTEKVA